MNIKDKILNADKVKLYIIYGFIVFLSTFILALFNAKYFSEIYCWSMFVIILPLFLIILFRIFHSFGSRIIAKFILTCGIYTILIYNINKSGMSTDMVENAKLLTLYIPVFCVILSWVLWYLFGKDRRKFEPVEFSSPNNILPIEMSYFYHQDLINPDVSLTFIDWMKKGYITISDKDTMVKIKDYEEDNEEEKEFFNAIFKDNDTIFLECFDIKRKYKLLVKNYLNKIKTKIEKIYMEKTSLFLEDFCENLMFLSWLSIFMFIFFNYWVNNGLFYVNLILSLAFCPLLFLFCGYEQAVKLFVRKRFEKKFISRYLLVMMTIFVYGILCLVISLCDDAQKYYILYSQITILMLLTLIIRVFQLNFVKWNILGRQISDRVSGFKKYLSKVEVNQIKVLKDDVINDFQQLLPYMYLFNLIDFDKMEVETYSKNISTDCAVLPGDVNATTSVRPHIYSMLKALRKIQNIKSSS